MVNIEVKTQISLHKITHRHWSMENITANQKTASVNYV